MTTKIFGIKDLEERLGKMTLSRFLSSWRVSEGLSQKDFAKTLGISPANLCDLEKGRKGASVEKVSQIAKKIGYPAKVLLKIALQEQLDRAGLKYEVEVKSFVA